MFSKIKLSICIPTYNRSNFLMSIFEQLNNIKDESITSSLEVCVSDNASTDDTEEMVLKWMKKNNINIKYSKNSHNEGADNNFLKSVAMAEGDYCWLFGSDDLFAHNAIEKVLAEINISGSDIYLFNRVNCDIDMNPIKVRKWFSDEISTKEFDFKKSDDLIEYLKGADSLGAIFSYLSSIVFKRKLWRSQEFDSSYIGTGYSHVYYLMSMVSSGCKLYYLDEALVLNRGGNDSFLSDGKANRALIDLYGYSKIADDIFKGTDFYMPFLDVLTKKERKQFKTIMFLRYYSNSSDWERSIFILRKLKYSGLLISMVSIFKYPIINFIDLYLKIKKSKS